MELEQIKAAVQAEIAEHGHHVILVESTDESPAYGFSIGLWSTYQHPEFVVFGVDDASQEGKLHRLLDLLCERVAAGERFATDVRIDGALEGYVCTTRAVHPRQITEWLDFAARVHGGEPFDCLQVIWPDPQGRFPWENGFPSDLLSLQPLLDKAPPR